MNDFGTTRYCKLCNGEIVRDGDAVTMYAGKIICQCNRINKPITEFDTQQKNPKNIDLQESKGDLGEDFIERCIDLLKNEGKMAIAIEDKSYNSGVRFCIKEITDGR